MNLVSAAPRELSVAALCKRGELPRAAATLFASHGTEVFAFLEAFLDDHTTRSLFGEVQERAMAELLDLDHDKVNLRTWLFSLARRAHLTHVQALEAQPAPSSRAVVSSQPRSGPRTKAGFDALAVDDKHLLVLCLDRGLRFDELAEILYGATDDDARRKRWAEALQARCTELQATLAT